MAFETAITANYDAQSAVERELVLRLASLLWRLRRATDHRNRPVRGSLFYALFGRHPVQNRDEPLSVASGEAEAAHLRDTTSELANRPPVELARCPCGTPTCRISRSTV